MPLNFSLLMFSADPAVVAEAIGAGVDGFVVDWENKGKAGRQQGFDTQINFDTLEDLRRVVALTDLPVLCRVNNNGDAEETHREIDTAIDAGASEVLLPMVRTAAEVEAALRWIDGRLPLGILIETPDAVLNAPALGTLPLSRVYVGLHDLAVARGTRNLFEAVGDGTVAHVRQHFRVPFGFGGATLPDHGYPVPAPLLFHEFARLDCSFTFLRRSFLADSKLPGMAVALGRIRGAIADAFSAPPAAREHALQQLVRIVGESTAVFERSEPAR